MPSAARIRPSSARPPALVFGGHVTGLAVLRAFGRSGVPAFCVGSERTLISHSRWYRPAPGAGIGETADGDRLAAYLGTLPFGRSVLFPCSDQWALAVAALPASVTASHAVTVTRLEVLRSMIDKQLFAETASRHGVPAPRVVGGGELDALADDELRSFFLKPRNSQLFAARFGVKGIRLESRRQARELVERMTDDGIEFLLQEYVPGPPTSHVFLDGYVDRSGAIRACLARRRLRMHPQMFGNSTLSVTIPLDEVSDAYASLRRLFEGVGFVGLFDAEFKQDARDGRFRILEVNARPWWQLALAGASGLDVCTMAYLDALGEPLPRVEGYRLGTTWVHPVPDLQAWWSARRRRSPAGGLPVRAWFGGANAVFAWDDPKPALDELARSGKRILRGKTPRSAPPPPSPASELVTPARTPGPDGRPRARRRTPKSS